MSMFSDLLGDDEPVRGGATFVRASAVVSMLSISKATIHRLVAKGQFPKPVKIGSGSFWVKSELLAWQREKMTNR